MIKKWVLTFCLIPLVSTASSTKEQIWSSLKFSSKVSENFGIAGEYINRYSHDNGQFTVRSNRLGFYYTLLHGGKYSFLIGNRRGSSATSNEIRIINQYEYSWLFEKSKISGRGRLEIRDFSDAGESSQRIRTRVKVDVPGHQFSGITPFAAFEYFHTVNEISNRPAGATELLAYLGGSFEGLGGKLSLAYLSRTTESPAFKGSESSKTHYNILDFNASWAF